MAYKKIDEASITSVANAIRAKGGTSAALEFPDGFVTAIGNIKEGADLPILVNPGTADDVLLNKEVLNQGGELMTGTIPTKSESSVIVSENIVTIPSGYYKEIVKKSVSAADQATPEISVDTTGKITATAKQSAGYVASGTKTATKQLTSKGAATIVPGTSAQTIPANTYLTGAQTINGDANLKGSNIKDGVTIFGVEGTLVEGITPTGTKSITANGTYDIKEYASANVALPTTTQATPSISVDSSGLITANSTQSAGVVSAGTKSSTKQLTTQAAKTITPSTSTQTAVASGVYTTGAVSVEGDSNLIASNIRSGKSIFGVSGTLQEGITPSGSKTITDNGTYDVASYASANVQLPKQSIVSPSSSIDKTTGNVSLNVTVPKGYNSEEYDGVSYLQLDTQAAQTITPGRADKVISSGVFLTGDQTITGSTNLVSGNIKSGINIFGVDGSLVELPSMISKFSCGSFSPSSDYAVSQSITHNLGSYPDIIFVWATDYETNKSAIKSLIFWNVPTSYNGDVYTNPHTIYSSGYYNGSGASTVTTGVGTSSENTNVNTASVAAGTTSSAPKFGNGMTYRWIALCL